MCTMNPNTIYTSMQKRAWGTSASSSGIPAPAKPYSKPTLYKAPKEIANVENQTPSWGTRMGNWFKQKAWDADHDIDTLFGTRRTYGTKRTTDDSYGGSFGNAINPFYDEYGKEKPKSQYALPSWGQRMLAEQKGNFGKILPRNTYNNPTILGDENQNRIFYTMAKQEAMGKQYDKLRNAGYSPAQITNYIVQEKYLPLVRQVTGKQNISGNTALTDQNWAAIKEHMLNRQMQGIKTIATRPDPSTGQANTEYAATSNTDSRYRDALSQAWDARMQAMRNGQDPNKAQINYSDTIKNDKIMSGIILDAVKNRW